MIILTGKTTRQMGYRALLANTTGDSNTACGVLVRSSANTSGIFNTGLRQRRRSVMSRQPITLLPSAAAGQNVNNSCFIGQIYTNVQPQVGIDPDLVTINSNGRLGRANVSSRRYKHDIQPMHTASEAIYAT